MKFLLMFLMSFAFLASSPAEEKMKVFFDEVDKGYSHYEILIEESSMYHDLAIVKGLYNNKTCYGICFVSNTPKEYTLVINYDEMNYTLETDERGDSMGVAILADEMIYVHAYDKSSNELHLGISELPIFVTSQFNKDTATLGSGLGGTYTELTLYNYRLPFLQTFTVVTLLVVGLCGVLILLLLVFRKGLFNKDKRRIGVVNVREILKNQNTEKTYTEEDFWDGIGEEVTENSQKPNEEVIFNEDVQSEVTNIKEYLQNLGYVTTYNVLSEEEKNSVMLELMKLKNERKISLKDYYAETGELWKK